MWIDLNTSKSERKKAQEVGNEGDGDRVMAVGRFIWWEGVIRTCNTVTGLLLSFDDYDDPMIVIDDVIHPRP